MTGIFITAIVAFVAGFFVGGNNPSIKKGVSDAIKMQIDDLTTQIAELKAKIDELKK